MSTPSLSAAVQDYLALRRSFGFVLAGQDGPLADFAGHLERAGLGTVTVEAARAWAVGAGTTALSHYQRLAMVRGFAVYLQAIDPSCEVPPRDLLPEGYRRVPPHIYKDEEVALLMAQSRLLRPPLRAATTEAAIGLLAVTGIRSGELVRLDQGDVDLGAGRLRVIATKFKKSRELALHATTVEALQEYGQARDRYWPRAATKGFFVSSRGSRLGQTTLEQTFAQLVGQAGLVPPPGSRVRRPRLHDLRHSFAVTTLVKWPKDTYWYLTGVPELLAVASERAQANRQARQ